MDRERTHGWDDPRQIAAMARQGSGIAFLERLIAEKVRVPVGETNGFRLVAASAEGTCTFEAEPGEWAYNPIGSVHGGWAACVLDAALGVALHATLPEGVGYTTLELKVNLTRPIQAGLKLLAEGRVVHRGRRVGVTEATLKDADGRMYAHATSTCLILEGAS